MRLSMDTMPLKRNPNRSRIVKLRLRIVKNHSSKNRTLRTHRTGR